MKQEPAIRYLSHKVETNIGKLGKHGKLRKLIKTQNSSFPMFGSSSPGQG